ncbi:hypothetical protein ABMZ21_20640, partial [Escherichia coli]|nr:hypothetical protein [Escherichia coli]MDK6595732.1 hypothetical protein [Escherichia coli]MDK6699960.1 hypothetical protein [Escherichia coli]MDK6854451.1 hypothetical protein [Escherichia coli]MDK6904679.1 hypothetical protein [Escherichia coli]
MNVLSGLRMARKSVGLISVALQALATTAGCGVNALSGLRMARKSVGLISVALQALATTA